MVRRILVISLLTLAPIAANADPISLHWAGEDPSLVSVSVGRTAIRQSSNFATEVRLEYRWGSQLKFLKFFGGVMANSTGALHEFAGVLVDIYLGDHIVLTPSFAPGLYQSGSQWDLGFPIEFRSQLELSFRISSAFRLGINANHISNARLGHRNPGVEAISISYVIPLWPAS